MSLVHLTHLGVKSVLRLFLRIYRGCQNETIQGASSTIQLQNMYCLIFGHDVLWNVFNFGTPCKNTFEIKCLFGFKNPQKLIKTSNKNKSHAYNA